MAIYGHSISNEIQLVKLCDSKLFAEYSGMSFVEASYCSIYKHVNLIGVREAASGRIMLNPGEGYHLVGLFY
jgi:hypothetical protein